MLRSEIMSDKPMKNGGSFTFYLNRGVKCSRTVNIVQFLAEREEFT